MMRWLLTVNAFYIHSWAYGDLNDGNPREAQHDVDSE
jgi:hypothetical protein